MFESASDFLARDQHTGPACVIVDVRMPGLNGIKLQETLIQRRREEQLIFITGHGDIPMCAQAMKAGAVDFLPKPFEPGELLKCVERALTRSAGQRRVCSTLSRPGRCLRHKSAQIEIVPAADVCGEHDALGGKVDRTAEKNKARQLLDLLTPREFEVMQLVIMGMLNKQIAAELHTAEKTIKVHRGRVMQKLGVTSVADLVRLSERAGVSRSRKVA